jgi:hypothetical protein
MMLVNGVHKKRKEGGERNVREEGVKHVGKDREGGGRVYF